MKKNKPEFTLLNHTADLGFRFQAESLPALFALAAETLIHLLLENAPSRQDRCLHVVVTARDREELLVNWLGELLYLFEGEEQIATAVHIERLEENRLKAAVAVTPYQPDKHRIRNPIKAVTYHQVWVKESADGWKAQVIVDV